MTGAVFSLADMESLTELVATTWLKGSDRDWSVAAGTLEWSCTRTAAHAVDTVIAPAMFLASRYVDHYPAGELTFGDEPTPGQLVEGLRTATNILAAVVTVAEPEVRAIIWLRPEPETRPPADFVPRAGLELILHAHDVCAGLGVPFEPPADLCGRLREHTREWPMWKLWSELPCTDDPWGDLLAASGRRRI
ncbi:MAG TPA: hypothetical protein VHI95_08180 [Acidimicrobiales bacterium]|jgi:hypothetical protein|nr:hypothetical protein [Acidimicrobiales bacterium]